MPRFFFQPSQRDGNRVTITGEDASHIAKVIRLKVGDTLTLCDGACTDYTCEITALDKSLVTAAIKTSAHSATEPKTEIHLYQSIPKAEKMEWIIQKTVELGIHAITPVYSQRCIVPMKSAEKKISRWQKIAEAAAKQSERGIIPTIYPPISFQAALKGLGTECSLIAYEKEDVKSVGSVYREGIRPRHIFIGPEGGYSKEEILYAADQGAISVSLGKRILRTETAGFVLLTLLQHLNGEL